MEHKYKVGMVVKLAICGLQNKFGADLLYEIVDNDDVSPLLKILDTMSNELVNVTGISKNRIVGIVPNGMQPTGHNNTCDEPESSDKENLTKEIQELQGKINLELSRAWLNAYYAINTSDGNFYFLKQILESIDEAQNIHNQLMELTK